MHTKTAIVILNWNGKKFLEKFLPALFENTPNENASIWIVDNNSSDNSIDFLKQDYPQANLVVLDKNYGFAGGYNEGSIMNTKRPLKA